ncbi:MAG: nucleoside monophosphate kinase [Patescibacteria group bacterium]
MQNKILILGPQGSGKGTQAVRLSQKLKLPALSMGQLLRDEIATGSELGKEIDEIIHGDRPLVPDYMALDVLKKRLEQKDTERGYILDGYPRTMEQYEMYKTFDIPTAVMVIDVPREESLKRLNKRAEIEGRSDDTPELINRRLELYHEETEPVIETYRQEGILHVVDGVGEMEEVEQRVNDALEI